MTENLNLNPEWLRELLTEIVPDKQKWVCMQEVANIGKLAESNRRQYFESAGISCIKRYIKGYRGTVYCMTEEDAKRWIKERIGQGYEIKI